MDDAPTTEVDDHFAEEIHTIREDITPNDVDLSISSRLQIHHPIGPENTLFRVFPRFRGNEDRSEDNIYLTKRNKRVSLTVIYMMSLSFFPKCLFHFLGFDIINLSATCHYFKQVCEKSKLIQIKNIDIFELMFRMFHENTNGWNIHIDEAYATFEACKIFGGPNSPIIKISNHRITFADKPLCYIDWSNTLEDSSTYRVNKKYDLDKLHFKTRGIKIMKIVGVNSSFTVSPFLMHRRCYFDNYFESFCSNYSTRYKGMEKIYYDEQKSIIVDADTYKAMSDCCHVQFFSFTKRKLSDDFFFHRSGWQ